MARSSAERVAPAAFVGGYGVLDVVAGGTGRTHPKRAQEGGPEPACKVVRSLTRRISERAIGTSA
jgi:hypothetical protein